ncbi:MAG: Outer membrane protein Imp, required for envelope biogenesis / Organic solvent tolerance protein precursor [uncultured Sulfurovum sp.]|uniref:Outer membrane protein Imp, required for envelope biogenesis / Organic solvent tolerance protein n=1 Tax=uncultured Sulfurovum sp. TaxID=269237 RepID=A0A6S6TWB8_9BACT|nr:MAG: Outer membrane protein Imp, required for envelope biogenesis / Organic solvent tolerance protein precursor [uncultured Sulfurovum sp.]
MDKIFKIALILVWALFFVNSLYASKLQVNAKTLNTSKNIVYASDGAVIYYNDSVIKADKATFNRDTELLVLDGNIEMIGYKGTKEYTDYMEIQTKSDEVKFEKLFMAGENDIWLYSNDVNKSEGNYSLGQSILSSCDIDNPLWKMSFNKSHYDSVDSYMKVYDAKIYFWDMPILYTPYLAFSTNKERSSGLLFPLLGYGSDEGIVYEQPIFWNISPSVDMEFNPQIRARRSVGGYATLRFADTNNSEGKLRVGYFKDREIYQRREGTTDLRHTGVEFFYSSSKVFADVSSDELNTTSTSFKDGLLVDTTYISDIDYLYLQERPIHFGSDPTRVSILNYFIQNNDYYGGVYAKYFIDTRKENDDETLQQLPTIHLHKYLDRLIWNNLTYSADFEVTNLTRKVGATLQKAEFNLPLEYTTSFFNDHVHFSAREKFYYSKYLFGNGTFENDNYQYYSNVHEAEIFTDLTKKYENYVHVIQPSLEYIKPGSESGDPVAYEALGSDQKELFSVGLPEEQFRIGFKQYLYSADKIKLKFFQRFSQIYYPNRAYKWSDIDNEMNYNWNEWTFYNHMKYAPEFSKIRELTSSIRYKGREGLMFQVEHGYQTALEDSPDEEEINDINFDMRYMYNNTIGFNAGVSYDIETQEKTQWQAGISYSRDCWDITTSYRQEFIPSSAGVKNKNTFYLQLNFKPFGGIGTNTLNDDQR